MTESNFAERMAFSQDGERRHDMLATLKELMPSVVSVRHGDRADERVGVDWIARQESGVEVKVDTKERAAGASRYWDRTGPQLALETWSVMPEDGRPGKVGWTLNPDAQADFILFLFHISDSPRCYLLSFPLLRAAFERHRADWMARFKVGVESTEGRYKSECAFVPVSVVTGAIREIEEHPSGGQEKLL